MSPEKILVIEDLPQAIEKIERFYAEYYPKQVELEICTTFQEAQKKIQQSIEDQTLGTYHHILMDGRLERGQFTDPLIQTLLSQDDVPPLVSISASKDQSDNYHLPHAQKWAFEHIATALYGILLWEKIQLKDNISFENIYLNSLIDHTTFKNRSDDNDYRRHLFEALSTSPTKQEVITPSPEIEEKKPTFFQKIFSQFKKK